jgi:dimethylargininase
MLPSRIAITRPVSRSIIHCELTHLERQPIDYDRAVHQHEVYEQALVNAGCEMAAVPAADDMPDAVFVEDAAVVLDEVAVMTRPGAESRRGELPGVEAVLARYRPIERLASPATLDGGDVFLADRVLFVGRSTRTNDAGIEQLRAIVAPHGYEVKVVPVEGCLHLRTAVSEIGNGAFLGNSAWADRGLFGETWIEVDPAEPYAANALRIGTAVIYPNAYPRTTPRLRAHLEKHGMSLHLVDADELAKAEAGVTCCSIVFAKK